MNRGDAENAEIVQAWLAPPKKVNKTNENPNIFLFPVYSLPIVFFCNLRQLGGKDFTAEGAENTEKDQG